MSEILTNRSGETITREDEQQLLDGVQRWLDREVADKVLALEHADEYPHEMVAQMKELGLFGATIGQEYGGLGLTREYQRSFDDETPTRPFHASGVLLAHALA